jgi:hypothetical protein
LNPLERNRPQPHLGAWEIVVVILLVMLAFWSGWLAHTNRPVAVAPRLLRIEGVGRDSILVLIPPDSSFTLRWDGYNFRRVR